MRGEGNNKETNHRVEFDEFQCDNVLVCSKIVLLLKSHRPKSIQAQKLLLYFAELLKFFSVVSLRVKM